MNWGGFIALSLDKRFRNNLGLYPSANIRLAEKIKEKKEQDKIDEQLYEEYEKHKDEINYTDRSDLTLPVASLPTFSNVSISSLIPVIGIGLVVIFLIIRTKR